MSTISTLQELPFPIPEGATSHRRKCFGGILIASLSREGEAPTALYLLVKGRHTGIWSFPKGHMKRGEEPLHTARREIEEETGLTFPAQLPYRAQRLKGAIYFYFACDPLLPFYKAIPHDAWEVEEVRWVSLQEMSELPTNSGIKDFLRRQGEEIS